MVLLVTLTLRFPVLALVLLALVFLAVWGVLLLVFLGLGITGLFRREES
jgi:hypothetical protein